MIDARGRSCPEPVIMIKKAMDSKENCYEILVDNRVAVENITRFAKHSGYTASCQEEQGDFKITVSKL